ncbi:MAG: thymidine phosphorylase [Dethiobacter sp.]|jgi:pyrimidine-nucleoside phosphorylase|nr:thymidine phosphorylase [Dethiobacter sp.]MBS3983396.1 thymidine phosphorylase [Dethiobacter sp.]MCL4462657.1 thymidine phosphorylase [Bacillota bacterium]MCL5994109.1 thymidine phosphorylase [Bacillota bacterium]
MNVLAIIQKKRDGNILAPEEINYFIKNYQNGAIPDYQAAAFLMAIYFQGMDSGETAALTEAIVNSGETLDFSLLGRPVADKHSTGGVGDKTTLVLLPLLAANGVTVAKISGRGLGHTGGTIDKLSCIPGFQTELSRSQFLEQVRSLGLAIMSQSAEMTPADGMLYALRDVTATVDSIPLIASSVMSKKIAAGAQYIILDVKAGSGAFMRDEQQARRLAEEMVAIGRALGRKTVALITAMDQPLGLAVGNHLEVLEAIATLKGEGPSDLTLLTIELGAELLVACGLAEELAEARGKLAASLRDGSALAMFRRFVAAQGGDPSVLEEPQNLGSPAFRAALRCTQAGVVAGLDARAVGLAAVLLGAGREKKGDSIDLTAGIYLHKKIGDSLQKGDILAELFTSSAGRLVAAQEKLAAAYLIGEAPTESYPLLLGRVE